MQTFEVIEKKVNEKETRTSKKKKRKGGVHDISQMVKEESRRCNQHYRELVKN